MSNLPPALVYFVGALLLPLLPRNIRPTAFLLVPIAAMLVLLRLEPGAGATFGFLQYELAPLRVDRLSLLFAYVFTLITFLGGVYALHVKDTGQQIAALFYGGSALGAVFAGDLLTLFVFWEIMAVASVILILARRTAASYRASIRYFFVHLAGGSVLMAGILWHVSQTGSLAFDRFDAGPAAWLILAAFAVNGAIPPLHAWLADAYPEGTVTGSVFLSAFTTKTAVYALARGFPGWEILIWAGVVMALYGVVYAVLVNDIRRILAYHIVSQVGFMVAGVGIGTEAALNGATGHAFTHILYKALLFMGAGAVLHATGRSRLTELGGLARAMPVVLVLYMVGAFSISGFPLFSGFVSKPITVDAAEAQQLWAAAMLLNLASVGTFLHTGLKLPYFTWFGPQRNITPGPVPKGMIVGMSLAAAINIAIGVQPSLLYGILPFPTEYVPYTTAHLLKTSQLLLFTFLGFWLLRSVLGGEAVEVLDTDWLYRRPAPAALEAVGAIGAVFGATERLALGVVRTTSRWALDPAGHARRLARSAAAAFGRRPPEAAPAGWALPLGVTVLVVVTSFVVLLARFLFP